MADPSKNIKIYGAAEIERYYNGELSPKEMHELEKAALEDSFLAEALEGYNQTNSPKGDIAELKARIQARQQNGKIISINRQKEFYKISRITIMILLLSGAGWMIYQLSFNKPETKISQRHQTERFEAPSVKARPKEEDAQTEQKSPLIKSENKNRSTLKKLKHADTMADKSIEPELKSLDTLQTELTDQALTMTPDVAAAPPVAKNEESNRTVIGFKRAKPLEVENPDNRNVEVIKMGNQVMITIKEAQDGINEMVLTQNRKDSLHKSKNVSNIIVEEAEPEESWDAFGTYISDHLPEDIQAENIQGTVKLSFDVNPSGKPVNIHVEKSLCQKCDAQALKLLEEGPKWKRKTKRGKVTFSF